MHDNGGSPLTSSFKALNTILAVGVSIFGTPLLWKLALPAIDHLTLIAYDAGAVPLARQCSFYAGYVVVFIVAQALGSYAIAKLYIHSF